MCPNGKCIKNHVLCDGHKDCSDRSDENASMCKVWKINIKWMKSTLCFTDQLSYNRAFFFF